MGSESMEEVSEELGEDPVRKIAVCPCAVTINYLAKCLQTVVTSRSKSNAAENKIKINKFALFPRWGNFGRPDIFYLAASMSSDIFSASASAVKVSFH
jgi:hypothetical protein